MRTLLRVSTLSLVVACGATSAQSQVEQKDPTPSPQASKSSPSKADTAEQIRKRGADWLAQCLQDWDAATHMTKKNWQRVCRRVSEERVNELIKQAKQ